MLNRERIKSIDDRKLVKVLVPDWPEDGSPGVVFVKMMRGVERDAFEKAWIDNNKRSMRAILAVYSVCDDKGNLLFTPEDVDWLGNEKAGAALVSIWDVSAPLNKITKSEIDEVGND